MKVVSSDTTNIWTSGDYVGANRAMMRATIAPLHVQLISYNLRSVTGSFVKGTGKFASSVFGQALTPIELPNIKSIRWSRGIDQDVATMTMTLYNTRPLAIGQTPSVGDLDAPGYYSPDRGTAGNRWGHAANEWRNLIVPDRIVKTYEGYGFDPESPPESDPAMYPSGVWLIDEVNPSALGDLLVVECRDLGRQLLEQIMFPPVVPFARYPLTWTQFETVPHTSHHITTGWNRPRYQTDSNMPYVGTSITDGGHPYVGDGGVVYGHHGKDAFDTSEVSYWLSVGNRPNWSSAFEYVQGGISGTVNSVKVHAWGGPYRMWISVAIGGVWQGRHKIPYRSRVVDTNADIRYVKVVTIDKDAELTVRLPRAYANTSNLRITFSHLYNSGLGAQYRYRAGVRSVHYHASTTSTTTSSVVVGDYDDYTTIVKWLCAWGGFYWPLHSTGLDYITASDGTQASISAATDTGIFPAGRVWGDFELAKVAGLAPLGVDIWNQKPLMDGINYVKEILGFIFHIDEAGGVIFRMPNIFAVGNYVWDPLGYAKVHTTSVITIDERTTLIDLTAKMSSRNIREKIFIGNVSGGFAAIANGYNPNPSGLRRVGGWTDQNFKSTGECQIMADMIALRAGLEYRTDSLTIAANPAIQIDDQVRIYERRTGEQYLHHVRSVTSEWDIETGKWTYQLDTSWLGTTPFTGTWAFNPTDAKKGVSPEALTYLQGMGKVP